MATEAGITVEDVTVVRGGHTALTDITFSVGGGTLMGVLGPNRRGQEFFVRRNRRYAPHRKGHSYPARGGIAPQRLAYVPQRDSINWVFPATVIDVVTMGRGWNIGWLRQQGSKDKEMVRLCLERVNLWEHRNDLVTELSGGQRQRVFIARALAQEASVILLDEAFSGVDVGAQEGIVEVLRSLRDEGKIVLLATHDLTNLAERFDSVLCINHHVCAYGPPDEAFTPEVLEEMYGSHGIEFAPGHFTHRHHP
ncbi:Manganese transport system ATP-binding protein MntB [Geodia barretti]|uniref:Manganese transport system ATP-binding protein MntB n=1 Tax=Geodia barretti TaxID=519541 RepID=A0AA35WBZ8_GEOBA|nr:Manganese transport system ATP-binding protein MntB [Geodia barretti]